MKRKICFLCFILFLFISKGIVTAQSELQTAPEIKRNFDSNFKERYKGRNYNYEGAIITRKNKTSQKKGEDAPYKDEVPADTEESSSYNFNGVFMPFAIIVLIFAVIYLIHIMLNDGGGGLFTSRRAKKLQDDDESITDIIQGSNLEALIKKAEENEDYRLAIRYNYLSVLKKLALQGVIKYEDEKTNSEYQNEIEDKSLHKRFSYVSYLYNYIWYGEFHVNHHQYQKAKSNFTLLLQKS
ncbi:hypothetical protein GTQ40_18040 [Flavobacteriaceae bacterium R38]|nr:hypothetical protein [Flavobacteriaceae bacterium R38]